MPLPLCCRGDPSLKNRWRRRQPFLLASALVPIEQVFGLPIRRSSLSYDSARSGRFWARGN